MTKLSAKNQYMHYELLRVRNNCLPYTIKQILFEYIYTGGLAHTIYNHNPINKYRLTKRIFMKNKIYISLLHNRIHRNLQLNLDEYFHICQYIFYLRTLERLICYIMVSQIMRQRKLLSMIVQLQE
jgi:hypothetical protein